MRPLSLSSLVAGSVLVLALVWQHLEVYFTFSGQPVVPTSYEKTRYLVTAALALAAMAAALVLGLVGSFRWIGRLSAAGLLLALVVAAVFSVPTGRWRPSPDPVEPPQNREPCFSGSNDCGPGG